MSGSRGARARPAPRRLRAARLLVAALVAAAPFACAAPPPPVVETNPLLGVWATADNDRITLQPDTVVQNRSGGGGTALDKSTCAGVFRFEYGWRSRKALTDLVPGQPELRARLAALLVAPSYRVAQLVCDRGDQTYVLLADRQLVAIYRDGAVAAIERFRRI